MASNQIELGFLLDWRRYQVPDGPAVTVINIPVQGFQWWLPVSAQYQLDNTANVSPAVGNVAVSVGQTPVAAGIQAVATNAGQVEVISHTWFTQAAATGNILRTASLPFVPVIGDGNMTYQVISAGGGWLIRQAMVIVVGRLLRPRL